MTRKSASRHIAPDPTVKDDYLNLVKRFPLRPIRTTRQYDAAAAMLDSLVLRSDLTRGKTDYLDALSLFIEEYDRQNVAFDTADRTPLDMLKHLMDANDMTVTQLGTLLGSKGIASEILHGKRDMSKAHIFKLADRFCLEPGLFLQKTKR